jgi:hypothetical protein
MDLDEERKKNWLNHFDTLNFDTMNFLLMRLDSHRVMK